MSIQSIGISCFAIVAAIGISGCGQKAKSPPKANAGSPSAKSAAATSETAPQLQGEDWSGEWTIVANAIDPPNLPAKQHPHGWFPSELDSSFNNRPPFEGTGKRTGLLILHPISNTEPAKVSFKGSVPQDRPILLVDVAGSVHGDFALRCVANGKPLGEFTVDGKQWSTFDFDLSEFAGKPVELELWNVPGGSKPWYFETCFIDQISFGDASSRPQRPSPQQELAISIINQLGGKYEDDPNRVGKPIIKVHLAGTKANDQGLQQLKGLNQVEVLDLHGCYEVGDAGLAEVGEMKNLTSLMLWGCHKITDKGFAHLQGLNKLEWLNIGYTGVDNVTGSGLVHFKGMNNLKFLGLNALHQLEGQHLANLAGLPNLEELGIGYCEKVTLADLDHIGRIPKLRSLDLNGDKVTDEWIPKLKEMKQLKTINLSNTQVTQQGIDDLQKALPDLKVTR